MNTFAFRLGWIVAAVIVPIGTSLCVAEDPSIVFVSRSFSPGGSVEGPVARGNGALQVATFDGAAGKWSARDLVNASLEPGRTDLPTDVADPDVSYDGKSIIFSGYDVEEHAWRIFEVGADGANLKQITTSSRSIPDLEDRYGAAASRFQGYDDVDPCYLPDGRICFVSTRYPGVAPGNRSVATNLYVVNADGSDVHRITSERFGADTPAVDPSTGEIAYSRWWLTAKEVTPPSGGTSPTRPPVYYGPVTNPNNFSSTVLRGIQDADYEGVNNWFIATIHPDGSGLSMRAGFGLSRELTMAYRPSFLESGELIAQFITESPILNQPSKNGLRLLGEARSTAIPRPLGGPQAFDGSGTLQDPNPGAPVKPRTEPQFLYHSSNAFGSDRILVTGALRSGGDLDYDVFVQALDATAPSRLFGTPTAWELDAVALTQRALPNRIADAAPRLDFEVAPRTVEEAVELGGTFQFQVENIFANGPVDMRIASAPPLGRDLTIEFYMNPQRQGVAIPEPPILVGSKPIGSDGKVEMELPAGVPLFEVLRRSDGRIALGRDGQAFHVGGMNFGVRGTVARCVGCHAGHSQLPVPEGEEAAWSNVAPSALVTADSSRGADSFGSTLSFPPAVLVDRLTDPIASEWAASSLDAVATIQLRWIQPIYGREVIVHGPRYEGHAGSQFIHGFTVSTYLQDQLLTNRTVSTEVRPEGTPVSLDPSTPFDILKITIRAEDVTGLFEGETGAALSEVEVIGKGSGGASPTLVFIEGDVNCDTHVNMPDVVVLLDSLFKGGGALCCDASADTTAEGRIDIADAIFLLSYLYRGGEPPSLKCERVTGSSFTCEQESCP